MVKNWIAFLLVMVLVMAISLAACMPVMLEEAATPAPSEEATPVPAQEATAAPTAEATEEATEEAVEEATAEPASEEPGSEAVDMGALVSQILAQQLQIDLDQIEVVSVEEVEWPDACLGVYTADTMCAQVITPGYRVVLAVDGQQYEYHTNIDGSFVQLFAAPEANVGEVLISWQQTLDTCQAAQIGTGGVIFGPCMGVMMNGKLVTPERETELADLIATYAPFETETAAGIVTFNGQGSAEASPAEQRMIAEWARLVTQEAASGRSGASWSLAFAWHREGGLAGFCDDLTASITGQLYAATCKSESQSQRRMSAEELAQVFGWIDEYAPFEYIQDDGDVDDAMKVTLVFSGAGDAVADEDTQQTIVEYARELYMGMEP